MPSFAQESSSQTCATSGLAVGTFFKGKNLSCHAEGRRFESHQPLRFTEPFLTSAAAHRLLEVGDTRNLRASLVRLLRHLIPDLGFPPMEGRVPESGISRRLFTICIVGVCVLSAAIGSGITLLARTGPQGPRGPSGPEGPPGRSADEASYQAEEALDRASELDGRLGEVESNLPVFGEAASASDLSDLESSVRDLESTTSELCVGLEVVC